MMMTAPQYLQVPKILPHRKGRSRSKSRSQDVVEVHFSSKTYDSQQQRVKVISPATQRQTQPQPPAKPAMAAVATVRAVSPVNALHSPSLHSCKNTLRRTPPSPALEAPEVKIDLPKPTPTVRKISTPTASVPAVTRPPPNLQDLNGEMYTLDDSATTPPPEIPLRSKIIGAWKLESYIAYPTEESNIKRPTYPMTKNVTGFIMYTPDGYMSAQMLIPGQQSFKRGEGEEPQWAEAGKRCFSYCGPYYITDEGPGREEILRHTFQVCNLPGWIGDVQVRTHKFEEDGQVLVLGSEEPTEIKGDKRRPVLKWRRARDNSDGTPPPPTPAIKISGPGEP